MFEVNPTMHANSAWYVNKCRDCIEEVVQYLFIHVASTSSQWCAQC